MQIANPTKIMSPYNSCNALYALTYTDLWQFITELSSFDLGGLIFGNKADYVINLKLYPFKLNSNNIKIPIVLNGKEMKTNAVDISKLGIDKNNVIGGYIGTFEVFDISAITTAGQNDFRKYPPYTYYSLFLPLYGMYDLDISKYMSGKYLYIDLYIDYSTGKGQYCLYSSNSNPSQGNSSMLDHLYQDIINFQCGIDVPISGTNAAQVFNNMILTGINAAIGFGTSGIAYKQAAWSATRRLNKGGTFTKRGQALGELAQSAQQIDTVKSIVNSFNGNSMRPINCNGQGEGYLMFSNWQAPYIVRYSKNFNNPNDYANLNGRPLMEVRQLSNMHGYTKCLELHIENIPEATSNEISEIEDMLLSGVILPNEETPSE